MSKKSRRQHPASRNNRRANIDAARALPRYDPEYLEAWNGDWEDTLEEILDQPDEKTHHASSGQLRGIPCIGKGVTGAIDDTVPGNDKSLDRLDHEKGNAA